MKKKRVSIAVKLLVVIFSLYAAVSIVQLNSEINKKQEDQISKKNEINKLHTGIEELSDATQGDPDEDLIEKIARDQLGLVKPGEQIYKETSGSK